jgi:(heptosyl)LPS beta-1,4-glucosyltransferase
MLHNTYRSLDDYARKIHRFSRGGALNEHERGKRGSAWKIFAHGVSRFFKTYLLKLGFLDGAEGLIIAFMEADYAALKYAKLWELQNKTPARSSPGPGAAAGKA